MRFSLESRDLPICVGPPLPNLVSATLDSFGCLVNPQWLQSPRLQELDINIRYISEGVDACARSANVARTLLQASAASVAGIQKLRVKGWMSPALDATLRSLRSLRHITLHTGRSLTPQALSFVATLPNLEHLYIHCSHIEAQDVTSFLRSPTETFPRLHTLRVRASRELVSLIFSLLPSGRLRSLYIESEESQLDPKGWRGSFSLLAAKAATSLISLTIDRIADSVENADATPAVDAAEDPSCFTVDALQPLGALRALRHFTLDTVELSNFTDEEIDQLASWWPELATLDLGTTPGTGDRAENWMPKATVATLERLATRCPALRALTIALDATPTSAQCVVDGPAHAESCKTQLALRALHVGCPDGAEPKVFQTFTRTALRIFPNLAEIDVSTAEKSITVDITTALREDGEVAVDRTAGTEDGFADGQ